MALPRIVTHAYRMPGGWEPLRKRALTVEYAQELQEAGFTMMRTRRGWRTLRERSIATYLQEREGTASSRSESNLLS